MSVRPEINPSDFIELPILAATSTAPPVIDLLQLLLDEQQQLTAVEEFSQHHAASGRPAQEKYYSKLLPATPPSAGQQYAFEVDLDRCSGCKACVVACHSLNGLDIEETWRDVGLLIGGTKALPVMQHVTTACHHCLEPSCMSACPVDAYEKDPVTGIVRHLDDQCFGCQYCTLACPYDVPKYHSGKGIVRKCDMCSDRLAVGEAPACVQACPHEAIAIRVVDVATVRENSEADAFLPAAPEPYLTYPTTSFKTERVFPRNMLPADYFAVNPQHPHWPLILMLVLTQLSVGAFTLGLLLEYVLAPESMQQFRPVQSAVALILGLLALGASTLHLGRPQYAYRAIIGLRHSWLSREILVFGAFAGSAVLYSASQWLALLPPNLLRVLGLVVVLTGLAGVFCSIMIYVATRREFWSFGASASRFLLTTIVLGLATGWLTLSVMCNIAPSSATTTIAGQLVPWLAQGLVVGMLLKLLYEASLFLRLLDYRSSPLKRSALLMSGPLSNLTFGRFACGLLGGLVMPTLLISETFPSNTANAMTAMLFIACLIGELLERYLFFAAVSAPRMPGGLRR